MPMTVTTSPDDDAGCCTTLCAGATLDVRDVEADLRTISEALQPGTRIRLDLAQTETIDTAGIQLLLAALREGARRGIPVDIVNVPAPVARARRLLGIALEAGDERHAG